MLDPPEPKTLFFARNLDDFTRFVFEAQKCLRQPRHPPRWLQNPQSWPQIAHPDRHLFVCVRQKGFASQTSKIPKGIVVGHKVVYGGFGLFRMVWGGLRVVWGGLRVV